LQLQIPDEKKGRKNNESERASTKEKRCINNAGGQENMSNEQDVGRGEDNASL
jgi:hypothetical protein